MGCVYRHFPSNLYKLDPFHHWYFSSFSQVLLVAIQNYWCNLSVITRVRLTEQ
jgi:hypothetical protein